MPCSKNDGTKRWQNVSVILWCRAGMRAEDVSTFWWSMCRHCAGNACWNFFTTFSVAKMLAECKLDVLSKWRHGTLAKCWHIFVLRNLPIITESHC